MSQQNNRKKFVPPPETYSAAATGQHYKSDKAYKEANWHKLSDAEQNAITKYERSCSHAAVTMWVGFAAIAAGIYFGGWILGAIAAVVAWFFFTASGRSSAFFRMQLPSDHPSNLK